MIVLNKEDLKKILEIMDRFPETNLVDIEQDRSSGIGCITTVRVETEIQGLRGEFVVEISGVEDW